MVSDEQTQPTVNPAPAQTPTYEQYLGQYAYRQPTEKSFIDKLLSRREVEQLRILIEKDDLTRQDLLKLLYMLTSSELKLANFNEYDRYLLGKYFTWIRDLVKLAEFLYDYIEQLDSYNFSKEIGEDIKATLLAVKKMYVHDVKFSADIFLFLTRSSLSLTALGFDTLSTQRYEYEYSNYPMAEQPSQKSFWNPFRK